MRTMVSFYIALAQMKQLAEMNSNSVNDRLDFTNKLTMDFEGQDQHLV